MSTLDLMNDQLFIELYGPVRPRAGDTKGASYRMSKEEALKKMFIETNRAKNSRNLITLDIDDEDSVNWLKFLTHDEKRLPEFSYITTNPFKGTSHVGYFLESSVGTDKGIAFLEDVRKGLSEIAGGDPDYTGQKTRNPLSPGMITTYGTSHLYTLKELKSYIEPKPRSWYTKKKPLEENGSRTIAIFNALSSWSYREWRKPEFKTRIMLEAQRMNSEFENPLPMSSLITITRSIEGFIARNFSEAQFSEIQRRRALKRHGNTREETNQQIREFLELGFKAKEIAEHRGTSVQSVYELIRRVKKEMEQESK